MRIFGRPAKNKIILLDTPEVDISSTGIRERVLRRGLSIKGSGAGEGCRKEYILEGASTGLNGSRRVVIMLDITEMKNFLKSIFAS